MLLILVLLVSAGTTNMVASILHLERPPLPSADVRGAGGVEISRMRDSLLEPKIHLVKPSLIQRTPNSCNLDVRRSR